jgi:hypothetical protein
MCKAACFVRCDPASPPHSGQNFRVRLYSGPIPTCQLRQRRLFQSLHLTTAIDGSHLRTQGKNEGSRCHEVCALTWTIQVVDRLEIQKVLVKICTPEFAFSISYVKLTQHLFQLRQFWVLLLKETTWKGLCCFYPYSRWPWFSCHELSYPVSSRSKWLNFEVEIKEI